LIDFFIIANISVLYVEAAQATEGLSPISKKLAAF
jgi:hypothetical protein